MDKHIDPATDIDLHPMEKHTLWCYRASWITSSGIWQGDFPFRYSFPLLMAQIVFIFIACRLTHGILKHLGMPRFLSQVIVGIMISPSFLGHSNLFRLIMFPLKSRVTLDLVSMLSFMFFIFVLGVKMDMKELHRTGREAFVLAQFGTIPPFLLVIATAAVLRPSVPPLLREHVFVFQLSTRWAITSNSVILCLLEEFNLLTSKLGRLSISASVIGYFMNMSVALIATTFIVTIKAKSMMIGLSALASYLAYFVLILYIFRPLTLRMIRQTPLGEPLCESHFLIILIMVLSSGLGGQWIGLDAFLGPLVFGLALPEGAPLGSTLVDRLDRLNTNIFLPVAMAMSGLKVDVSLITDMKQCGYIELLIMVSVVSKFIGNMIPCLYAKMPLREAVSLALILNCRGFTEFHGFNNWLDLGLISPEVYAILAVAVVVVGGFSASLLKLLYNESARLMVDKRRAIQLLEPGNELSLLACIHREDDVPPVLALLEASHATQGCPICLQVLHLVPLVGHAVATLLPYTKRHRRMSGQRATASDHIIYAFQQLEQNNQGCISLLAYVSTAPYATMHEDIYMLALENKSALIIVPFHRHVVINGTVGYINPAVQSMNVSVLNYAPCSVGILIYRGNSTGRMPTPDNPLLHRIGMYFIGGPDDREALAFVKRMAKYPTNGVTVVRFVLPAEMRIHGHDEDDEILDDKAVREFRVATYGKENMAFKEEVVKDGAAMVNVIRGVSTNFSLQIVGSRHGQTSPVTSGLEMWEEYPELGIIGDVLASTDFGGSVSTLVVQQQPNASGGAAAYRPHQRASLSQRRS